MSQLESFAHRDVDGCEVSSAPSAPSGFWLCCPRGRPLLTASSPGSTGWSDPSLAGSGWSAGPYTDPRWGSRRWTAGGGELDCPFPPTRCWLCGWRGPRAAVWRVCVWSFSLWMCTGRYHCQKTAGSGSEDLVLFSGCVPLSGSVGQYFIPWLVWFLHDKVTPKTAHMARKLEIVTVFCERFAHLFPPVTVFLLQVPLQRHVRRSGLTLQECSAALHAILNRLHSILISCETEN